MALTASEITLCNMALNLIGEPEIAAGDSGTTIYTRCEGLLDHARDEITMRHPWNEATKRVKIVEQAQQPISDYDYKYALPSDCLRVWKVDENWETDYRVEGSYLLCNVGTYPDDWEADTYYYVGDKVVNNDITFECIAAHYSDANDDEPGSGTNTDTYWKNFVTSDGTNADAWLTSTAYTIGDLVVNDTVIYECTLGHTSGTLDDEPGTGAVAGDYWREPIQKFQVLNIEYIRQLLDSNGDTDVSAMRPLIKECIGLNLAIKIAIPTMGAKSGVAVAKELTEKLEKITLRKARAIDAQEGSLRQFQTNYWWKGRND